MSLKVVVTVYFDSYCGVVYALFIVITMYWHYVCRKNIVLETCFMLFGSLISLWKEFGIVENGHYFALMKHQVWQIVGVRNLRSFTISMKEK